MPREELYTEKVRERRPPDGLNIAGALILSDPHFGHERIAEYAGRPADWERQLLAAMSDVDPEAPLLVLGDWFMGRRERFVEDIAPQIVGKVFWVRGNHDRQNRVFYENLGFRETAPFSWRHRGWTVTFTHQPAPAAVAHPRHLNVHGHIHEKNMDDRRMINVSVEQIGYRPAVLTDLLDARIAELT